MASGSEDVMAEHDDVWDLAAAIAQLRTDTSYADHKAAIFNLILPVFVERDTFQAENHRLLSAEVERTMRGGDQTPEQRLLRALAPRLAAMSEAELVVAIAKCQDILAVVRP